MSVQRPSTVLVEFLRNGVFRYANEEALQQGIAQMLDDYGIGYEREARLDARSRLDFLVDDIGIEVKIDGTGPTLLRQLRRYAQHGAVRELILVTSRTKHLHVPDEIEGKPLSVVWLSLQGL